MIRLVERLPDVNPDPLDLPDGVLIRPSIVAIFDAIAQEIILVTTVRPSAQRAEAAYAAAAGAARRRDRRRCSSRCRRAGPHAGPQPDAVHLAGQPRGLLARSSSGPRTTSAPATSSRWCPATASARRSPHDPFALYRSLRRTNPSPFLFYPELPATSSWSAPRRRSWCACATARSPSARSPAPGRAARRRRRTLALEAGAARRPQGARRAPDAARPRPQRRRPRRHAGPARAATRRRPRRKRPHVRVTDSFFVERYSHVMHLVSNVEGDAPEGARSGRRADGRPARRHPVRRAEGAGDGDHRRAGEREARRRLRRRGRLLRRRRLGRHLHRAAHRALSRTASLYVQAGGGVVADSDPDAEYEETPAQGPRPPPRRPRKPGASP